MSAAGEVGDVREVILARLAEVEAVARAVPEVSAKSEAAVFTSLHAPTGTVEIQPTAVLAWVAGIRAVVGLHHEYRGVCAHCIDPTGEYQREAWPCSTLTAIAAIWAPAADSGEGAP